MTAERLTIIAWNGNVNDMVYLVPQEDVQIFLDRYNDAADGAWQVVPGKGRFVIDNLRGPYYNDQR